MTVRLHVNVDHVATLRQARGTPYPDPVEAALRCERAGAHGITVHLREDRRHIQDRDVEALRERVTTLLNLEMAATEEMVAIAERVRPDVATLVPERREERTTEGGLDVASQLERLRAVCGRLEAAGVRVSLFIDPDEAQVRAAAALGAGSIELHTGDYCDAPDEGARERELARLAGAAALAARIAPSMKVAAGHGLTSDNLVDLVARVPEVEELNIGHALVSDAVFLGLEAAVARYLAAIDEGERRAREGGH
ncbi:MAG TPA: pyridoxine 5'-phosphate synthase [Sandaracinaceae bacterium]